MSNSPTPENEPLDGSHADSVDDSFDSEGSILDDEETLDDLAGLSGLSGLLGEDFDDDESIELGVDSDAEHSEPVAQDQSIDDSAEYSRDVSFELGRPALVDSGIQADLPPAESGLAVPPAGFDDSIDDESVSDASGAISIDPSNEDSFMVGRPQPVNVDPAFAEPDPVPVAPRSETQEEPVAASAPEPVVEESSVDIVAEDEYPDDVSEYESGDLSNVHSFVLGEPQAVGTTVPQEAPFDEAEDAAVVEDEVAEDLSDDLSADVSMDVSIDSSADASFEVGSPRAVGDSAVPVSSEPDVAATLGEDEVLVGTPAAEAEETLDIDDLDDHEFVDDADDFSDDAIESESVAVPGLEPVEVPSAAFGMAETREDFELDADESQSMDDFSQDESIAADVSADESFVVGRPQRPDEEPAVAVTAPASPSKDAGGGGLKSLGGHVVTAAVAVAIAASLSHFGIIGGESNPEPTVINPAPAPDGSAELKQIVEQQTQTLEQQGQALAQAQSQREALQSALETQRTEVAQQIAEQAQGQLRRERGVVRNLLTGHQSVLAAVRGDTLTGLDDARRAALSQQLEEVVARDARADAEVTLAEAQQDVDALNRILVSVLFHQKTAAPAATDTPTAAADQTPHLRSAIVDALVGRAVLDRLKSLELRFLSDADKEQQASDISALQEYISETTGDIELQSIQAAAEPELQTRLSSLRLIESRLNRWERSTRASLLAGLQQVETQLAAVSQAATQASLDAKNALAKNTPTPPVPPETVVSDPPDADAEKARLDLQGSILASVADIQSRLDSLAGAADGEAEGTEATKDETSADAGSEESEPTADAPAADSESGSDVHAIRELVVGIDAESIGKMSVAELQGIARQVREVELLIGQWERTQHLEQTLVAQIAKLAAAPQPATDPAAAQKLVTALDTKQTAALDGVNKTLTEQITTEGQKVASLQQTQKALTDAIAALEKNTGTKLTQVEENLTAFIRSELKKVTGPEPGEVEKLVADGVQRQLLEWGYVLPGSGSTPTAPDVSEDPNPIRARQIFKEAYTRVFFSTRADAAEESVRLFSQAVQHDPTDPVYRYFLGLSLYRTGQPEQGLQQVRLGATLENQSEGSAAVLNQWLERVQQRQRLWLERIRRDVRTAG